MTKKGTSKSVLADPSRLRPRDEDDIIGVVIETPKGEQGS